MVARIMNQFVLKERQGAVIILTLNRPERHNSLIPALLESLLAALAEVQATPEIRSVLLQAEGRSFSTGGDVLGFYDHLEEIESYAREIVGLLNQVMLAMIDLPCPIVSAVQGTVTGGSLGLILASDVVLIAPEASLTPYYGVVGFSPDGGWTALLPNLIGPRRAAELLLLNRTVTAEEAVRWGIASRIVPAAKIRFEALTAAQNIAGMKPGSIYRTKKLLNPDRDKLAERLERERQFFVEQIVTEEARVGLLTFMQQMKAGRSEVSP
jgi:2-(1,2-epoxy-1,2-dihydrophenyl)acetyl-CoA isomerase